jgi:hypothetical protein
MEILFQFCFKDEVVQGPQELKESPNGRPVHDIGARHTVTGEPSILRKPGYFILLSTSMPFLSQIHIYPVKSLGGISLESAQVTPRGLLYDRRWMLVDEAGVFVTQREVPQLATIRASLAQDTLTLSCGGATMQVPLHNQGEKVPVRVWRDTVLAVEVGELADVWLSELVDAAVKLVWMPEETHRAVNEKYGAPGDIVSFADGFPFLLFGQASLDDLNNRLDEPIPANRFRPNFVIEGSNPYEEDSWTRFQIGEVEFERAKECVRCVVTTTDQETGERRGPEPLRTLAQYRKNEEGGVFFAQNLIARSTGVVRVGDELKVTS